MSEPDNRKKIDEIIEVKNECLTAWEIDFITSIDEQEKRKGFLSPKQGEILERIYKKVCDSPY